ncbi:FAD/NAD(P)-binding domain-containing protein [Microthyrium microscopicum]|uniref:FAD/NAD(P)-binding domain-containing protein n=1 Tax=Microthyrium microscopicum TaxID=703497 RepID=A0A6A6TXA6_9PEZI|nr:FAD/NAD(P)-binding domain-containing protein [Microthyrium microscopicum]
MYDSTQFSFRVTHLIKSVAVIGAGAAGAVTAAALAAEGAFDVIRVFERRGEPGGTWIYDSDPEAIKTLQPGKLPPEIDPPLAFPSHLPHISKPSSQTNVPDIDMSFSDQPFPYGTFVPHWIPRQYIGDYFATHRVDKCLVLNTTVEDVTRAYTKVDTSREVWRLTLRRFDASRQVDVWWKEEFDALIIANGHYSVPFIPQVPGLEPYMVKFPNRVSHSRSYRSPELYTNKRVLVIGNSASGKDITTELVHSGIVKLPVYQSRRSRSRWDGNEPPEGVAWKPVIVEYDKIAGDIIFQDDPRLRSTEIDAVIYCTGYKPSFPFWNSKVNGGQLFDYSTGTLINSYQHTFSRKFPDSLGIFGFPRVLTFRSFEYQAVALARLFAGRNATPLPPLKEQENWEKQRAELVRKENRKFPDIPWDNDETMDWLRFLFQLSGLPLLEGYGRCPPVLGEKTRWAM